MISCSSPRAITIRKLGPFRAEKLTQWGHWRPGGDGGVPAHYIYPDGTFDSVSHVDPDAIPMVRVGKKAAGRLLDRLEWSQYPDTNSTATAEAETNHHG